MDGQWSLRASNLRYLMRDGRVLRAGPDVTASGPVRNAAGEPSAGEEIFGDVPFEFQHWTTKTGEPMVRIILYGSGIISAKAKVNPLTHLSLHRKNRNQDAIVVVDNGKWETKELQVQFHGGSAKGRDDRTKPLKLTFGWGSKAEPKPVAFGSGTEAVYAQWTFTRTCENSNTPPPNIYVPPVADPRNVPTYPFPTPPPPPPKLGDKAGDAVNNVVRTGAEQYLDDYRKWIGAEPIH